MKEETPIDPETGEPMVLTTPSFPAPKYEGEPEWQKKKRRLKRRWNRVKGKVIFGVGTLVGIGLISATVVMLSSGQKKVAGGDSATEGEISAHRPGGAPAPERAAPREVITLAQSIKQAKEYDKERKLADDGAEQFAAATPAADPSEIPAPLVEEVAIDDPAAKPPETPEPVIASADPPKPPPRRLLPDSAFDPRATDNLPQIAPSDRPLPPTESGRDPLNAAANLEPIRFPAIDPGPAPDLDPDLIRRAQELAAAERAAAVPEPDPGAANAATPEQVAAQRAIPLKEATPAIDEVVDGFFAAKSPRERAAFVRQPGNALPRMNTFYGVPENQHPGFSQVETYRRLDTPGRDVVEVEIVFQDFSRKAAVLEFTADGYRLDWESMVGYDVMDWGDFRFKRPGAPRTFRIQAAKSDFYSGPYSDPGEYACFALSKPEVGGLVFGYLRRSDPELAPFLAATKDSGDEAIPVRLTLQFPQGDKAQDALPTQVEVVGFEGLGWIDWLTE
ncbi:MAG: hypothetical protein R3F11_16375 [Verrucomicrobiales bacterium]